MNLDAYRPARMKRYSAPDRKEWDRYIARLVWLYGPDRAERIITGRDARTIEDLEGWFTLGQTPPAPSPDRSR